MTDWDQRILCPDGSCVGVIGADGTCKVCGRAAPNWGDERTRGLQNAADDDEDAEDDLDEDGDEDGDEDEDDEDDDEDEADGEPDEDGQQSARGEWTERTLCPDGACIGVIGDDGQCKVCGRSAA